MLLLIVQIASTLSMTGLIWFIQIVHYPLFLKVGEHRFAEYADLHATRITYVVMPLMVLELGSAVLLLFASLRPTCISAWGAWTGAVLVSAIWLSTGMLQVPLHSRLQRGFSTKDTERLVATNWVRTTAWSVRSVLVLTWTCHCLPPT